MKLIYNFFCFFLFCKLIRSYPVYAVGDFGTNNQQYFTTSSTSYTSTPVAPTNSSQVTSEYIIPDDGTILRSSQSDNSSPPTIGTELIYVPEQNRPSVSGISTDGDNTHGIAHATKVSPATVSRHLICNLFGDSLIYLIP